MIKKSTLAKKLASYSALASVLVTTENSVSAQTIQPDTSLLLTAGQSFYLDLHSIEFKFGVYGEASFSTGLFNEYILPYKNGSVAADTIDFPKPLNEGDTIGSKLKWKFTSQTSSSSLYNDFDFSTFVFGSTPHVAGGLWHKVYHKYVGLKVNSDSGTAYYGWARLSVAPDTLKIESYALNKMPDSSIIAGQGDTLPNPIIILDRIVCNGEPAILRVKNLNPKAKYIWYYDKTEAGSDSIFQAFTPGTYFVTETIDSSLTKFSNAISLTFDSLRINLIQYNSQELYGSVYYIQNYFPPFKYTWYLNEEQITEPSLKDYYFPAASGSYEVAVTDGMGCSVFSAPYDFVLTGVNSLPDNSAKIYAADNILYVELLNTALTNGNLNIFNELGQSVLQQAISSENFTVNLESSEAGIYFVRLEKNGKQIVKKIIVQ